MKQTGAAYPEYKSSGVQWLGDIPTGWEVWPLKHVTLFENGAAFKPTDWGDEGVPIIRIENLNGSEEFNRTTLKPSRKCHVQKGDILFGWSGNRGTSFGPFMWEREGHYLLNQHIFRLDGFHTDRRWFYWMLKAVTLYVEQQAHGIIGMVHITKGDLGVIKVPMPTDAEQKAIADFLDLEMGKLDAMVQKKKRLIELLLEKRTAVISHAVTKGLNPATPMKDSGIPWLGKIPAHWQAKRLKFLLNRIEQGWSPQCDNQPADAGKWAVLKTGCVNGGVFNAAENKALPDGMDPPLEFEVRPGDVLMSRASGSAELVGSVAMVTEQPAARLLLSDKTYRLPVRPQQMDAQLLVWAMGSPMVRHQIAGFISGAEGLANNITQGDIRRIVLAVPPLVEQRDIIQRVRTETTKLDALIAKVRTGIERLQEYRTALISAAVTGKIDVRQAQPSASKVLKLPPAAFRRAVFAAEVIHQLHDEPTFGHVKCQKILHLAEHHLGLPDFESNYFRQAAGPYDNQMMRSIDGQLERLKWFRAVKHGEAWHYDGLANAGQHEKYFGQYWGQHQDGLQKLLALLRKLDTERCEILSTLYAVWNDFLLAGASFDDAKLADEAIRWHPAKQRIERDRWLKALGWMREKGLVPRGTGKPTKVKK